MADTTIDKLQIDIEAEAKNAASSIDSFIEQLSRLQTTVGNVDVNKLKSIKTAMQDIGSIKFSKSNAEIKSLNDQINKLGNTTAKKLSDNLIKQFNITDKNIQEDVKNMSKELMKLESAFNLSGNQSSIKNTETAFDNLTQTVANGARQGSASAIQSYKEFYDYLTSQNKIYVDSATQQENVWKELSATIPGIFTKVNDGFAHTNLEEFYAEISGQLTNIDSLINGSNVGWKDLFPDDITNPADQLQKIVDVIHEYREMLKGFKDDSEEAISYNTEKASESIYNSLADYDAEMRKILNSQGTGNSTSEAYKQLTDKTGITGLSDLNDALTQLTNSTKNMPKDSSLGVLEDHIESLVKIAEKSSSVVNLGNGIKNLSEGMASIPKSSAFTSLAKGISNLNEASTGNINAVADALERLAAASGALNNSGIENIRVRVSNSNNTATASGDITSTSSMISGFENLQNALNGVQDAEESVSSAAQAMAGSVQNAAYGYTGTIEGLEDETVDAESHFQQMGSTAESAFTRVSDSVSALKNSFQLVGLSIPDLMSALESDEAVNYVDNIKLALETAQTDLSKTQEALNAAQKVGFSQDALNSYMIRIDQLENKIEILKEKLEEIGVTSDINVDVNAVEANNDLQNLINTINQYKRTINGMEKGRIAFDQSSYEEAVNGLKEAEQQFKAYRDAMSKTGAETQSAASSGRMLANVFRNLSSSAGNVLVSALNSAASAAKSFASAIGKLSLKALSASINSVANGLKKLASHAASAASGFAKIVVKVNPLYATFTSAKSAIEAVSTSLSGFTTKLSRMARMLSTMALRKAYSALFSNLGTAFQHLAIYSDEVNQKVSSLMSAFSQLSHSVAALASPLLNIFGPALTYIINLLNTAINAVNQFLAALTGRTYIAATSAATDYASGLSDAADSASDAADAQDDLNKSLQGFDELNNITTNDSSDGGSGSGSGGGSGSSGYYEELPISDEILEFVEKIKEAWANADFTEIGEILGTKLRDALDSIDWEPIQEVAEKIGKSVATLINGFIETSGLAESVGKTLGELINTGIALADSFFTAFHWDSLGTFIANALNAAVDTVDWEGLGKTIADYINGVALAVNAWSEVFDFAGLGESIATALNTALEGIDWDTIKSAAYNIGKGIADLLNEVITPETFSNIGSTIGETINTVVAAAYGFVSNANWGQWGEAIAAGLNNILSTTDWSTIGDTIATAINGLFTLASTWSGKFEWDTLGESIKTTLNSALAGIEWSTAITAASNIGSGIATALNNVIDEETFSNIGTTLAGVLNTVVSGAKSFIDGVEWKDWGDSLATAIDSFFDTFDWKKAGLTFKGAVTGIITALKTAIADTDWKEVGTKIGEMIAAIDFSSILSGVGSLIWAAIQAAFAAWDGAFDAAPVETVLVTAVAALSFTGLGSTLWTAIKTALVGSTSSTAATSAASTVASGLIDNIAAAIGMDTGATLGVAIAGLIGLAYANVKVEEITGGTELLVESIRNSIEKAAEALDSGNGYNETLNKLSTAVKGVLEKVYSALGLTLGGDESDDEQPEGEVTLEVGVSTSLDEESVTQTAEELNENLPNETAVDVGAEVDVDAVSGAAKTIDESFSDITVKVSAIIEEIIDNIDDEDKVIEAVGEIVELCAAAGLDTSSIEIDDLVAYVTELASNETLTLEDITAEIIDYVNNGGNLEDVTAEVTELEMDEVDGETVEVEGEVTDLDTSNVDGTTVDDITGIVTELLENYGDADLTVECIGEIVKLLTGNDASAKQIEDITAIIDTLLSNGECTLEDVVAWIKEYVDATGGVEVDGEANVDDAQVVDGVEVEVEGTASLTKTDTTKTQSPDIDSTGVITDTEVEIDAEIDGKFKVTDIDENGKQIETGGKLTGIDANGQTATTTVKASSFDSNNQTATTTVKASKFDANSQTATTTIKASSFDENGKSAKTTIKASEFDANGKAAKTTIKASEFDANGKNAKTTIKASSFDNNGKNVTAPVKASKITKNGNKLTAPVLASSVSNNGNSLSAPAKASSISNNGNTISAPGRVTSLSKASGISLTLTAVLSLVSSTLRAIFSKNGAIFTGTTFHAIPQYAGGTTNAGSGHGTLFVAGEAGAEVVGHIGGQTEVLNQSQLAAVMKSAITSGLAELAPSLQAIYSHMTTCTNALINAQIISTDVVETLSSQIAVLPDPTTDFTVTVYAETQKTDSLSNTSGVEKGIRDTIYNAVVKGFNSSEIKVEATFEVDGDPANIFKVTQKQARAYTQRTGKEAYA